MPILRERNMLKTLGEAVDGRHDGITVGNRKLAAAAEVSLHVNYQQQILVADRDCRFHLALAFVIVD
jgi:hypothetical protein